MKPNDEDETPPFDETSEDVDDEDFDVEIKIRSRRGSRRRRSKRQEYSSLTSFIAWMAFLIVWLFFFASGYELLQNIAVVIVSLLIVFALNAFMWIPIHEGWKARTSAISGVVWIIFLIVWFFFFSSGYGFYENIGIALASLLLLGALNVVLWVPTAQEGGAGGRISALGGITWLIFLVLWLPFANDFSLIYPINPYQNVAIVMTSFLLMMVAVMYPWRKQMWMEIDAEKGLYPRMRGTLGGFVLWLVFIIIWFLFFAGLFSGNQNVAILLLSFAVFCVIMVAIWLPWARKRGEGPESWFSIGLAFVWILVLALWFWFFADGFDAYQNFAVFLVSLLIMAAISGGAQWKKYHDFESMDWKD